MRGVFGTMGVALGILLTAGPLALPTSAQMMPGSVAMGGGQRTMINLVSPAASPIQIRRGMLSIGRYMHMSGTMMRTPAPQEGAARIWLLLRLYGVRDDAGLVTSTGNRLLFDGRLTTADGDEQAIAVDEAFALDGGGALVRVPVPAQALADPATILIDQVSVVDADGAPFAVPGLVIAPPATPHPTPGVDCTRDSDCDDGNANTRDLCMPMGCAHMPIRIGPGGGPMM